MTEENSATNSTNGSVEPKGSQNILNHVTKLIEAYLQIFRLELQMTLSDVLTMIAVVVIIGLFATMVAIFISIGMAFLFNHLFDLPTFAGFLFVALFYTILLLVIFKLKKRFRNRLLGLMDATFESISDNFEMKEPEEYL
ncbi:phage holin family protein [Limibacter armeniacum]|uniref:phage holin family protein n=1 Tax=Limibacter armeniacum TaxID=466084 RepID=UPI002FE5A8DC